MKEANRQENMIVTSQYMNILARIALQNPDLLLHVIRTADSSQDVVSQFVERWAGQKVVSYYYRTNGSLTVSDRLKVENSTQWVSQPFSERTTQQFFPTSAQ
jgi:hypothetical protein